MKTYDYHLPLGTLATVWRVEYRWQNAQRGCPPSHPSGATPDEPACAEIESAVLVHVGGRAGTADNRHRFCGDYVGTLGHVKPDPDGERLWTLIEESVAEDVIESERLHREIEEYESQPAN